MPNLIDVLRHNDPKRIEIDYQWLVDEAPKVGKASLVSKLTKRKTTLEGIRVTIRKSTAATIGALLGGGNVDFIKGKSGLKKNDPQRKEWILVLSMFDVVDKAALVIDDFSNADPDGQFPYFSKSFVSKHLAKDTAAAEAISLKRHGDNNTLTANSMLLPADAKRLHEEIKEYNAADVFKTFMTRIEGKADRYRDRNKRIADFVFRSRRKYTIQNCTQANAFVPQPYDEHVYFGIAWPNVSGATRYVVDHYAPRKTCMQNDDVTLRLDWKEIGLAKLKPGAGVTDPMWLAMSKDGGELKIYVKTDVIV